MSIALIETDELRQMIREELLEVLRSQTQNDEFGGVELAEQVTGLKAATIYEKVANREIPYFQEKKGAKITFSKNDLLAWQAQRKRRTRGEIGLR